MFINELKNHNDKPITEEHNIVLGKNSYIFPKCQ